MRLRNLVSTSLFTNIKFEEDEDSGDVCAYFVFKIFHTSTCYLEANIHI